MYSISIRLDDEQKRIWQIFKFAVKRKYGKLHTRLSIEVINALKHYMEDGFLDLNEKRGDENAKELRAGAIVKSN